VCRFREWHKGAKFCTKVIVTDGLVGVPEVLDNDKEDLGWGAGELLFGASEEGLDGSDNEARQ